MSKSKFIQDSFLPLAIEKGLLPDDSVSYAAAKIATKQTFDVSENLDQNIANLIFNLEVRGMKNEADELQKKWYESKVAKAQYTEAIHFGISQMLSAAHPEGDHWIGDSQYARFHTLESTQTEMLATLTRKASRERTRNIVKGAAAALGFLKGAQEAEAPAAEETFKSDVSDPDQLFELTADPETKKKAAEINEAIVKFNEELTPLKGALGTQLDRIKNPGIFDFQNLLKTGSTDTAFYIKANDINYPSFISFMTQYKFWFGESLDMNPSTVSSKILKMGDYDSVYGNLQAVGVSSSILSTYFYGSTITDWSILPDEAKREFRATQNMVAKGRTLFATNSSSIWEVDLASLIESGNTPLSDDSSLLISADKVSIDQKKLTSAAGAIVKYFVDNLATFYSDEKKTVAISALVNLIPSVYNDFSFIQSANISGIRGTTFPAVGSAQKILKSVEGLITNLQKEGKAIEKIYPQFPADVMSAAKPLQDKLNQILAFLSDERNQINPELEKPVSPQQVKDWISKIQAAAGNWKRFMDSGEAGEKGNAAIADFLNQINSWFDVLKRASSMPWGSVKLQLEKAGLKFSGKNVSGLSQVQAFVDSVYQDSFAKVPEKFHGTSRPEGTKGASFEYDLWIKEAQMTSPTGFAPISNAPKNPTQPATPGTKPVSNAPSNRPHPQANDLVRSMQYALSEFASKILGMDKMKDQAAKDITVIKAVGPSNAANPNQFDGVWGPNTARAIDVANKWLPNGLKLDSKAPQGMLGKTKEEIDVVAKKNFTTLSQVFRGLNVALQGGENEVPLDMIAGPVEEAVNDGQIPVFANNLISMETFAKFLTEKGLAAPQTSDGDKGFSVGQWKAIFMSFLTRAEIKANNVKGTASKNRAANYSRSVYRLSRLFSDGLRKLQVSSDQDDFIIDEESLKSMTTLTEKSKPGKSDSFNAVNRGGHNHPVDGEVSRSRQDGQTFEDDSEEDSSVPFSSRIDLRNRWFNGSEAAEISTQPLLSLQNFNAQSAKEQADGMFANNSLGEEAVQRVYLNKAGLRKAKNYEKFDEVNGTYWFVNQETNKLEPLSRYSGYLKSKNLIQNSSSLTRYQSFLVNLKAAIADAYSNWARAEKRPEELEIKIQDYRGRWLSAINHQLNQINRTFAKFSL